MATPKKPNPETPETAELDTSKLVKPGDDASQESTPLGDEAEVATKARNESTPIGDETAEALGIEVPHTADPVDEDVEHALQRETHDGKGEEDPGESDWNGYATEGVEVEGDQ